MATGTCSDSFSLHSHSQPASPPSLPLARVHRLLRPLRTKVTALTSLLERQPIDAPSEAGLYQEPVRGNGEAVSELEREDDAVFRNPISRCPRVTYGGRAKRGASTGASSSTRGCRSGTFAASGAGTSAKARERRSATGTLASSAAGTSSPFQHPYAFDDRRPSSFGPNGNRPVIFYNASSLLYSTTTTTANNNRRRRTLSTSFPSDRTASIPLPIPAPDLTRPSDELNKKIKGVVDAFRNVLEVCCRSEKGLTASHNPGVTPMGTRTGRCLPSLATLAARVVGSHIETNLLPSPETDAEEGVRGTSHTDDESMQRTDEWYEAVPAHYRCPALAHHAVHVITEHLPLPPPIGLLEHLLIACVQTGAEAEAHQLATLFLPALVCSLSSEPPTSTTVIFNADGLLHTLHRACLALGQPFLFASELTKSFKEHAADHSPDLVWLSSRVDAFARTCQDASLVGRLAEGMIYNVLAVDVSKPRFVDEYDIDGQDNVESNPMESGIRLSEQPPRKRQRLSDVIGNRPASSGEASSLHARASNSSSSAFLQDSSLQERHDTSVSLPICLSSASELAKPLRSQGTRKLDQSVLLASEARLGAWLKLLFKLSAAGATGDSAAEELAEFLMQLPVSPEWGAALAGLNGNKAQKATIGRGCAERNRGQAITATVMAREAAAAIDSIGNLLAGLVLPALDDEAELLDDFTSQKAPRLRPVWSGQSGDSRGWSAIFARLAIACSVHALDHTYVHQSPANLIGDEPCSMADSALLLRRRKALARRISLLSDLISASSAPGLDASAAHPSRPRAETSRSCPFTLSHRSHTQPLSSLYAHSHTDPPRLIRLATALGEAGLPVLEAATLKRALASWEAWETALLYKASATNARDDEDAKEGNELRLAEMLSFRFAELGERLEDAERRAVRTALRQLPVSRNGESAGVEVSGRTDQNRKTRRDEAQRRGDNDDDRKEWRYEDALGAWYLATPEHRDDKRGDGGSEARFRLRLESGSFDDPYVQRSLDEHRGDDSSLPPSSPELPQTRRSTAVFCRHRPRPAIRSVAPASRPRPSRTASSEEEGDRLSFLSSDSETEANHSDSSYFDGTFSANDRPPRRPSVSPETSFTTIASSASPWKTPLSRGSSPPSLSGFGHEEAEAARPRPFVISMTPGLGPFVRSSSSSPFVAAAWRGRHAAGSGSGVAGARVNGKKGRTMLGPQQRASRVSTSSDTFHSRPSARHHRAASNLTLGSGTGTMSMWQPASTSEAWLPSSPTPHLDFASRVSARRGGSGRKRAWHVALEQTSSADGRDGLHEVGEPENGEVEDVQERRRRSDAGLASESATEASSSSATQRDEDLDYEGDMHEEDSSVLSTFPNRLTSKVRPGRPHLARSSAVASSHLPTCASYSDRARTLAPKPMGHITPRRPRRNSRPRQGRTTHEAGASRVRLDENDHDDIDLFAVSSPVVPGAGR